MRILNIAGTPLALTKMAPLMRAARRYPGLRPLLVYTGRPDAWSGDEGLQQALGLAPPDVQLGCLGGSRIESLARMMNAFEGICRREQPEAVVVVGEDERTVACSLVAARLGRMLIRLEGGRRGPDVARQEGINRVLIDALADMLFCSEPSARSNLAREGIAEYRSFMAGSLMADVVAQGLKAARAETLSATPGLEPHRYAVLMLRSAVLEGRGGGLAAIHEAIEAMQAEMPVELVLGPRGRGRRTEAPLPARLAELPGVRVIAPPNHLDGLRLLAQAHVVLTDWDVVQEQTTVMHVPCLTLSEQTACPITLEMGSNELVGLRPASVWEAFGRIGRGPARMTLPPLWDGRTAERIMDYLAGMFARVALAG
jgi:UDP-N-acetylglucosamine 2-epimerase (non-hydrolysing)